MIRACHHPYEPRWYEVTLGHVRVRVRGGDGDEAVANARRQLCLDMPRLWDVIQTMGADRFQVRPLDAPHTSAAASQAESMPRNSAQ